MPPRLRTWAARLAAAYLALALAAWACLHFLGDAWAGPTLALFGPRWLLALPLAALVPLAAWARSRVAACLVVVSAAVVAGPVTGGRAGVGPLLDPAPPGDLRLRVVTWNMEGVAAGPALTAFLADSRADVVALQEADRQLTAAAFPPGWHLAGAGTTLPVAGRIPVRADGELDWRDLGAAGGARRYVLDATEGRVRLVNVHLPTERPGIEAALGSKLRNFEPLREVVAVRSRAAGVVRHWVGDPAPDLVVAGDFNTPDLGRVWATHWGDFRDAFSEAGRGWGATKVTSWYGVRIDHVLYAEPWRCEAAWVGPTMGSDHRPLVAGLALGGGGP